MVKKILLIIVGIILILIIGLFIFINTGPQLPPETDAIIDYVLQSELPEFIKGKTGIAKSGEIEIWYESLSPMGTPIASVLLVMGHSSTALFWPEYFIQPLLDSGYQVIRYDHRGLGMSDWMDSWNIENPYNLEDMAWDALAVMDALEVEKAHIIGVSMGGMISQRIVINHDDRVLSLTLIMTPDNIVDQDYVEKSKRYQMNIFKLYLKNRLVQTEKNVIKFIAGILQFLKGEGDEDLDIKTFAKKVLYELRHRRGYNSNVGEQHTAAIEASNLINTELGLLKMPTLIIHGKSDPLVPFEHGKKIAALIPDAKTLWIEGMGYTLSRTYTPLMLEEIFKNIKDVDKLIESGTDLKP